MTPVSAVLVPCDVAVCPGTGSVGLSYPYVTDPAGSAGLPLLAGLTQSLSLTEIRIG